VRPAGLVHARDERSESRRELETGGRSQLAKRVGLRQGYRERLVFQILRNCGLNRSHTMERKRSSAGGLAISIRLLLRAVLLRRDGLFSFWKFPQANSGAARHRMHHPYAMVAGTPAVFRLEGARHLIGLRKVGP